MVLGAAGLRYLFQKIKNFFFVLVFQGYLILGKALFHGILLSCVLDSIKVSLSSSFVLVVCSLFVLSYLDFRAPDVNNSKPQNSSCFQLYHSLSYNVFSKPGEKPSDPTPLLFPSPWPQNKKEEFYSPPPLPCFCFNLLFINNSKIIIKWYSNLGNH